MAATSAAKRRRPKASTGERFDVRALFHEVADIFTTG